MTFRSIDRLDPVSRLGLPRSSTLLRTLLIAILLALAAAALYADPQPAVPAPDPTGSPEIGADGGLRLPAGLVGVPIALDDAGPLAVLRPGDRVDLLALAEPAASARDTRPPTNAPDTGPTLLAREALVLRTVADAARPVLYVALTESQARAVIAAPVGGRYAVIIRPTG